MSESEADLTRLLASARGGDEEAMERLIPLVYDELRGIARRQLRRVPPDQTLNTTGLVHEAYLRLSRAEAVPSYNDRGHFFAVASRAMRHILVDAARRRQADKRGGDQHRTTLEPGRVGIDREVDTVLAIDQALERLEQLNERLARVVECRFFAGLTEVETASALEVTERTVRRDWVKARAWLQRELAGPD